MFFAKILSLIFLAYNGCTAFKLLADEDDLAAKFCMRPCPAIYSPTCGFDGTTYHVFSSPCSMAVENCFRQTKHKYLFSLASFEKCNNEKSKEKCQKGCPDIYDPVCGFNGTVFQDFANKCEFEIESCLSNYNWALVRQHGKCHEY